MQGLNGLTTIKYQSSASHKLWIESVTKTCLHNIGGRSYSRKYKNKRRNGRGASK